MRKPVPKKSRVDPAYQIVGAFLREQRKAVGWSQTDIGKVMGVSFQMVQKQETGVNRIPLLAFITAMRAMGTDPAKAILEIEKRVA